MGRTGQGAGVRDRGKKNKRVEWSEKWSKGRGWQGGGEAEGGQEEDWEVVCVTRELLTLGPQGFGRPPDLKGL